jgi:L,D-peptidoglycan transpeptidase YkuD (ErfK/YbiS/YcfS/YnhG family)
MKLWLACLFAVGIFRVADASRPVDGSVRQLVVAVAPDGNSSTGRLQWFNRVGRDWQAASPIYPVLFGKNGLAWGRGLHPAEPRGPQKVEKDKRAPAGVFAIGTIYTYDRALPEGADYPFHTITERDAWIDDPTLPEYNRHVVIDPANPPPWFASQRMRLNDPPHRWLIEIRHNADPPVAGAGSAIFFHIQRGPGRASAGCTVMPEPTIRRLIGWLRASAQPRYVLLTADEYRSRWAAWGLPSPATAAGLLPAQATPAASSASTAAIQSR